MKNNIIIYVTITLLACALTGTITYILVDKNNNKTEVNESQNNNNDNNQNNNENKTNVNNKDNGENNNKDNNNDESNSSSLTFSKLSNEFKKYYASKSWFNPDTNQNYHFYEEKDTKYWDITKITYLGYFKSDETKKYYRIEGKYECKDDSNIFCVYMEQVDDTMGYNIFDVVVPYKNGIIDDGLASTGSFFPEEDGFQFINKELK